MEKKGTTKIQHYVPQMILRKFSQNRAATSLMVLDKGLRVPSATVKHQCCEDYFYGDDQIMEKSFAKEEDKLAHHLGDLSVAKLEGIPDSVMAELVNFVHYQHARTRGAAEHLNRFTDALAKSVLRGTFELNRDSSIRPQELDRVEIGLNKAPNQSLLLAAKTLPLMRDMQVKFISTQRTPGFLIADHPVVAYNHFAEHHQRLRHFPGATGFARKGLQLFMPLSPSVTLAIYDPTTYQYGGSSRVCRAGPHDVQYLNQMQVINAFRCVFFDQNRIDEATLDGLLTARSNHPSMYTKDAVESDYIQRDDGRIGRLVAVNHPDLRVGAKLSFIRLIDGHSYDGCDEIPIRSQKHVALAMRYAEFLDEKVKERRAASVMGSKGDG